VLAHSFHVRKHSEQVLNASSVRNEENVPNVHSNFDTGSAINASLRVCADSIVKKAPKAVSRFIEKWLA